MGPLALMAIMAAVGAAKSELVDRPKEKRQRRLAATTEQFSPWTGKQSQPIQEADPLGSAMQYGATGAMMGSNMENAEAEKKLMEAQTSRLNTGGSLWGYGKVQPESSFWSQSSYPNAANDKTIPSLSDSYFNRGPIVSGYNPGTRTTRWF